MSKPKSKFIVCSPNLSGQAIPASLCFIAAIALAVIAILTHDGNIGNALIILSPALISLALACFFTYRALRYHVHKLTVNGREIALSSVFCPIKTVLWTTVESIHVCEFGSLNTVKRGLVHIGGIDVKVPKKIPSKWIMIADVKEDFCESIYEFLVPNGDLRAIKIVYDERILEAIRFYTEKRIINKRVGIY